MIEINLLPGAGRKSRRGGGSRVDFGASLASMRERVRQPYLVGAIAAGLLSLLAVAGLWITQDARQVELDEALQQAVQDSTRYASVLKEREKAEARRDTVLRSLNLIKAIDDDRFIWPHIMDEVSSSLPPYTWLVSLGYSGTGQAATLPPTLAPAAPADTGAKKKKRALATVIAPDTVRIRIVGNTVDIQALTRFMKQLETSPYLEQVSLARSERSNDNGKEVTQFQLDMLYSRPDPATQRRVPLSLSVR